MTYAKDTSVPVEQSEAEIKKMIIKYGASSYASFETDRDVAIAFEMKSRRIVFKLPLPHKGQRDIFLTPTGQRRNESQIRSALAQAKRSKWRSLHLCIKAKLESVESGIESFEDAFLAHVMMPDGHTVGEHVRPAIESSYTSGAMTPLLPGPRD